MLKKIAKVVIFLLVAALVLNGVCKVMKLKHVDGIYPLTIFYELPADSCDVMFFGTSHTFEGINPAIIWSEQGIPSYVLAGSTQPMWSTYFYMKEAFKYQKPKVVVLDIDTTFFKGDGTSEEGLYNDYSRMVKNTIGMRFSLDKVRATMVNAPKELWGDILLGFPTYHTRYTDLKENDFTGYWEDYPECWKGHCEHRGKQAFGTPDVTGVTEATPLEPKVEEWFLKILDLCEEEDVELLLTCYPFVISNMEQSVYLTVEQIANERNIPFINFNTHQELLNLDYGFDFGDENHLNYNGNPKLSAYMAQYLMDNYDLEDKRGTDERYDSWDANLQFYNDTHVMKRK